MVYSGSTEGVAVGRLEGNVHSGEVMDFGKHVS